MTTPVAVSILLATVLVAAYDLRTRRAPNIITLPLLALGLYLHFPGTAGVWVVCLSLFAIWRAGGIGAGDVKLWWALLWLTPTDWMPVAPLAFGIVLVATAGTQLVVRWWRDEEQHMTPASWRAVPYALWLVVVVRFYA